MGDSMADWLAYGLEDALGDTPDLAVVRKHRAISGLIRYDSRNESQDWAQVSARRSRDQAEVHRDDDRPQRSQPIRDRVAGRPQPRARGERQPPGR